MFGLGSMAVVCRTLMPEKDVSAAVHHHAVYIALLPAGNVAMRYYDFFRRRKGVGATWPVRSLNHHVMLVTLSKADDEYTLQLTTVVRFLPPGQYTNNEPYTSL